MSTEAREYFVGDVVHYRPHYPGDIWDDSLWWVTSKQITETWHTGLTTFYMVARVADPEAVWRVDTCVRGDMLRIAQAPPFFHEEVTVTHA
jgi:hypothetical protein